MVIKEEVFVIKEEVMVIEEEVMVIEEENREEKELLEDQAEEQINDPILKPKVYRI